MTRLEKIQLAIEKGYTYNPENGIVYGVKGNPIKKITKGYLILCFKHNSKMFYLYSHQFAWYCVNKECIEQIDHINGIRTDNRISNLRNVTNQENKWNRNFAKGYHYNKNANKFQAEIVLDYKKIYLGLFNTEEDARAAYIKAKEQYHII